MKALPAISRDKPNLSLDGTRRPLQPIKSRSTLLDSVRMDQIGGSGMHADPLAMLARASRVSLQRSRSSKPDAQDLHAEGAR